MGSSGRMGRREKEILCVTKFLSISLLLISKKAEANSCFIDQQLDILQCFNQRNSSISIDGKCCEALNQLVQAGYACFCSLITAHLPLLATPISITLADCYISSFPLISCQGQIPVLFPPDGPTEINQPSPPKPPQEGQAIHNSSRDDNASRFKEREKDTPQLNLIYRGPERCEGSGSGDKIREFPGQILSVLLPLALIFWL